MSSILTSSSNSSLLITESSIDWLVNVFLELFVSLLFKIAFSFLLSKISLKREDYLKSLGFITLGINMLKVFIIKKKVASDIKTYKIYCKLFM